MAWLKTLPAPVRVVYEAGPTRVPACATWVRRWRIGCLVAAPSKIRPAADRVKTDRRDAERLARLLRFGEIIPVRVPGSPSLCALRRAERPPPARTLAGARDPRRRRMIIWSPSRASSPDTAGRSQRWTSRQPPNGFGEESAPAQTTRGATRENTVSSPNGPRSTPENGTAPHLAYPVMRHQPAHMSRDTDVDDSRRAPPAEPDPQHRGRRPCQLTGRTPYECSGMTRERWSAGRARSAVSRLPERASIRARRLVSVNLDHDLATLSARRHSLERSQWLRERKGRVGPPCEARLLPRALSTPPAARGRVRR